MIFSRLPIYLIFAICLGSAAIQPARALQAATAADKAAPASQEAKESQSTEEQFRHSAMVKMLAGSLHMDTETAARSFEYLNFAILAGAVIFGLMKILPKTFRENRANIQQQLSEARIATEQANERLAAIEQKLQRLDEDIAAISQQAEKDSAQDEVRIKASIEAERVRITDAATRDIAAAGSTAQRDLKQFVAGLALDRATQRVALSETEDRSLVQEFMQEFSQTFHHAKGSKNGENN